MKSSSDIVVRKEVKVGLKLQATPQPTPLDGMELKWMVSRFLCSQRWILACMTLLGALFVYVVRVNLSVAIICMVKPDATPQSNLTSTSSNVTEATETPEDVCDSQLDIVEAVRSNHRGEFTWDKGTRSKLLAMYFYGYIFTQIPGGWLTSRYGGKLVWGVCMFVCAVCTLATPISARTNVYLMYAIRFILGFAAGVTFPCVQGLLGRWCPPYERTRLAVYAYIGPQIGTLITFSVSGYMCEYGFDNGWGSIFYMAGIFNLIWVLAWFYLTADRPENHKRISDEELEYIQQSIGYGSVQKVRRIPWGQMFRSRPMWAIIIAHAGHNFTTYTMITSLPTFMKESLKFDVKQNGLLSSVPFLVQIFASILVSITADKIRERGWLSTKATRKLFQATSAFGIAICTFTVGQLDCSQRYISVFVLCMCTVFMGFSRAGYVVNHIDLAPSYAGILFGLSNTVATVPGMIAPIIAGALTPNRTPEEWRNVFYVCGGVAIVAGSLYVWLADGELQTWAKCEFFQAVSQEVTYEAGDGPPDDDVKVSLIQIEVHENGGEPGDTVRTTDEENRPLIQGKAHENLDVPDVAVTNTNDDNDSENETEAHENLDAPEVDIKGVNFNFEIIITIDAPESANDDRLIVTKKNEESAFAIQMEAQEYLREAEVTDKDAIDEDTTEEKESQTEREDRKSIDQSEDTSKDVVGKQVPVKNEDPGDICVSEVTVKRVTEETESPVQGEPPDNVDDSNVAVKDLVDGTEPFAHGEPEKNTDASEVTVDEEDEETGSPDQSEPVKNADESEVAVKDVNEEAESSELSEDVKNVDGSEGIVKDVNEEAESPEQSEGVKNVDEAKVAVKDVNEESGSSDQSEDIKNDDEPEVTVKDVNEEAESSEQSEGVRNVDGSGGIVKDANEEAESSEQSEGVQNVDGSEGIVKDVNEEAESFEQSEGVQNVDGSEGIAKDVNEEAESPEQSEGVRNVDGSGGIVKDANEEAESSEQSEGVQNVDGSEGIAKDVNEEAESSEQSEGVKNVNEAKVALKDVNEESGSSDQSKDIKNDDEPEVTVKGVNEEAELSVQSAAHTSVGESEVTVKDVNEEAESSEQSEGVRNVDGSEVTIKDINTWTESSAQIKA